MYALKIASLMLAGFFLPVVCSLYFIASSFDNPFVASSTSLKSSEISESSTGLDLSIEPIVQGSSFAVVKSDKWLDPDSDSKFVVSFNVRFDKLPTVGLRHNIISKYASRTRPYPGWAVALHRLKTSMRPEVYLRGSNGSGGWFTFGEVSISPDTWYAFSLVIKSGDFVGLYVQEIGRDGSSSKSDDQAVFLGGHDIARVALSKTEADLYLGTIRKGPKGFRGEVKYVLLARPSNMPEVVEDVRPFLTGGPSSIVDKFKADEVYLWMTESGRDESKYARQIEFTSHPTWRIKS